MKRKISSSDIKKRLEITNEDFSFAKKDLDCENYYNTANRTNNIYNVNKFFRECAKSKSSCEEYIDECLTFLARYKDNNLNSYVENNIIPKVDNFTLNTELEKDYPKFIHNILTEQIEFNNSCDRIISNYNSLDNILNIQEMFDNESDYRTLLKNICNSINEFNISGTEKVQVALEESSYLFNKYHIDYNPVENINLIEGYYYFNNSLNEFNDYELNSIIEESPVLDDKTIDDALKPTVDNTISSIDYNGKLNTEISPYFHMITNYIKDPEKVNLDLLIHYAANSNPENARYNFNLLFKLYYDAATCWTCSDKLDFYSLNKLYDYIYKDRITDPDLQSILESLIASIDLYIGKLAEFDKSNDSIEECKSNFINLRDKFKELLDDSYPKYNIESMIHTPLSEYVSAINIQDYKDNYYTEFCKSVNSSAELIDSLIESSNYEIFKGYDSHLERLNESDLSKADVININHDCLDTEIANYIYNNISSKELNTFLCKVSESVNQTLNSKYLKSYYTLGENDISFYLRDIRPINLDEDTKLNIYQSSFQNTNLDNVDRIMYFGNCISDNIDIYESAVKFFSKHPETDLFETFLEAGSLSNISKDYIEDIYESIKESSINTPQFISKNSYLVSSYTPIQNDAEITLEAYGAMQAITEITDAEYDKYKQNINNKLKDYGYTGDSKNQSTQANNQQQANTNNNQINTHEIPAKKDNPDDYQDVVKNGPAKNLTPQNIKLFVRGIFNRLGDKGNKIQQFEQKVNGAFRMFARSVNKALVSDRREAIIKGSVIPSFTKCIKLAIAFCGIGAGAGLTAKGLTKHAGTKALKAATTASSAAAQYKKFKKGKFLQNTGGNIAGWVAGIITPIITSYFALCKSKQLTKKERALLLDDIAVELDVIDKEIQMAEQSNQLNKYRALLRLKKDLQRQYNRIAFNIRVGEDIIPARNADTDY